MPFRRAWIIVRITDGYVLPDPLVEKQAPSHLEPMDWRGHPPRLFHSKKAAISALSQWLRGKQEVKSKIASILPFEEPDYDLQVQPVRSRKKEDMEIVEVKVRWGDH